MHLKQLISFVVCAGLLSPALANDYAATVDKLNALDKRLKLDTIARGIKSGNVSAFSSLPAKGYPNGLAGLMRKYDLIAIPQHSFVNCDVDLKYKSGGGVEPGCIVSLKFGMRQGRAIRDVGIRAEWAVGLNKSGYEPNNSVWAKHIQNATGMFEAQFAGR